MESDKPTENSSETQNTEEISIPLIENSEKVEKTIPSKENQGGEKVLTGLPEIAESRNLKSWIITLLCIIVIAFLGYKLITHLTHPTKTAASAADDDYIINGAQPDKNAAQSAPSSPITASSSIASTATINQSTDLQLQATKAKQIEEEQKEFNERLHAPILIVNNRTPSTQQTSNTTSSSNDPNTRFLNAVSSQSSGTVYASLIPQLSDTIAEGTVIHAILETAINSDLPGYVRAIVSEPVYSEDGSQVLVVPGSRLIGQYKSQLQQDQTRLFVVWTEVIEPNGVSVQLNSPGTDNLGRSGMEADKIDSHFWKKIGTAVLLSVLSAGASNTDVSSDDADNASQSYREAVSQSLSQTASDSMSQTLSIPPTLYINQGKPIMVFVIHRLNFAPVLQQAAQKINIF